MVWTLSVMVRVRHSLQGLASAIVCYCCYVLCPVGSILYQEGEAPVVPLRVSGADRHACLWYNHLDLFTVLTNGFEQNTNYLLLIVVL